MYLVPALVAVTEDDPQRARSHVEALLRDSAVVVGAARHLPDYLVATADFDVRVYANNIELPARPA